MTTQDATQDSWLRLAGLPAEEREPLMRARYIDLAGLPEDARRAALKAIATAEYTLPDATLRPFTKSRMRVWLGLEPEQARALAASYDVVMNQMPATSAMRRVSIVQSLAREFGETERARLREIAPNVLGGRPSVVGSLPTGVGNPGAKPSAADTAAQAAKTKRAWWPFGKSA